jgi:hypothetical protein
LDRVRGVKCRELAAEKVVITHHTKALLPHTDVQVMRGLTTDVVMQANLVVQPVGAEPAVDYTRGVCEGAAVRGGQRWRPRGRVTRSLECMAIAHGLGEAGKIDEYKLGGGRTSLARMALSYLAEYLAEDVTAGETGFASGTDVFWVKLRRAGGDLMVVPQLVAYLATFGALRPRTKELLVAFRSRANKWLKDRGVTEFGRSLVLAGTLAVAMLWSRPERAAVGVLESEGFERAVGQGGQLDGGLARGEHGLITRILGKLRPRMLLPKSETRNVGVAGGVRFSVR